MLPADGHAPLAFHGNRRQIETRVDAVTCDGPLEQLMVEDQPVDFPYPTLEIPIDEHALGIKLGNKGSDDRTLPQQGLGEPRPGESSRAGGERLAAFA